MYSHKDIRSKTFSATSLYLRNFRRGRRSHICDFMIAFILMSAWDLARARDHSTKARVVSVCLRKFETACMKVNRNVDVHSIRHENRTSSLTSILFLTPTTSTWQVNWWVIQYRARIMIGICWRKWRGQMHWKCINDRELIKLGTIFQLQWVLSWEFRVH